jgi:hypothetical protein
MIVGDDETMRGRRVHDGDFLPALLGVFFRAARWSAHKTLELYACVVQAGLFRRRQPPNHWKLAGIQRFASKKA